MRHTTPIYLYTEFQKKPDTFTFYCCTYFQSNSLQTFGTKMYIDVDSTFAKTILLLKRPENIFLSRVRDVIENHKVTNLYVILFLLPLFKVVNSDCDQLSYDVG